MRVIVIFCLLNISLAFGQKDTLRISPGQTAPPFIMQVKGSAIQGITMPYMKKIVLLHFWNNNEQSRHQNKQLKKLAQRYRNASYKNAEGFEVIAIAVQADKKSWQEAISRDTLNNFTHGIAPKGFDDEACKKYGVTSLPADFLINESGKVIAINPRMADIENMLDENKNFQPIIKDISGVLAQSSNKDDALKFSKIYLLNGYGDSLARALSNDKGAFTFYDVKLSQDFMLKVDNKTDINTSDPIALYSPENEFIMDGQTRDKGFVFYISARSSNKLVKKDTSMALYGEIDIIKNLVFGGNGRSLNAKDEKDLAPIVTRLQKNKSLKLELITHTDARLEKQAALDLTTEQAVLLKNYFEKKGISPSRISAIARGNTELRKRCDGTIDCREEDHKLNRRVEFLVYKD